MIGTSRPCAAPPKAVLEPSAGAYLCHPAAPTNSATDLTTIVLPSPFALAGWTKAAGTANPDSATSIADVQFIVNEALEIDAANKDLNESPTRR